MYLNTLLQYLYLVFTSIAGKYFVFVFKYIWRAFCPSLTKLTEANLFYPYTFVAVTAPTNDVIKASNEIPTSKTQL